jgi:hypothetical protein
MTAWRELLFLKKICENLCHLWPNLCRTRFGCGCATLQHLPALAFDARPSTFDIAALPG